MSEARNLAEVIQFTEERFNTIAPSWMKYEAEKGFAIQLVKNSPFLEQAVNQSPASLQQAITNVAAIGLSLNPAEKLAYLIPRNVKVKGPNNQERWESRVYLEPSYMGLIRLATDSGSIEWIQAVIVRKEDKFIDNGPGQRPTHEYNAFSKDRGEIVGVCATAKTVKGDYLNHLMDIDQIHNVRDRSESYRKYKKGVWVTDFEEMAKKAAIRALFKTLPRTDERRMQMLATAVHLSNENEGFEPIISEPKINEPSVELKNYFDSLIENGDAFGMYCFMEAYGNDATSPEASIRISLMHSFPKGKKGYYQDIVAKLKDEGSAIFFQYGNDFHEAASNGWDEKIKEMALEMTNDQLKAVISSLMPEDQKIVEEVLT